MQGRQLDVVQSLSLRDLRALLSSRLVGIEEMLLS